MELKGFILKIFSIQSLKSKILNSTTLKVNVKSVKRAIEQQKRIIQIIF